MIARDSAQRASLYVIVDRTTLGGRDPIRVAEAAVAGGADLLQLRDKTGTATEILRLAHQLRVIAHRAGIPLLLNDRPDLVVACDADGVHIGQDDIPVPVIRQLIGPDRLIGKSTHSLEQALKTETEDVNYLSVGPVYATPTKPEYAPVGLELIRQVKPRLAKPWFAIGGISEATLDEVLAAGAERVVVVRAAILAEDVEAAVRRFKDRLLAAVKV